jgi:RES domain-containing protein
MVTAWRIVKRKYAKKAFDGEGARRFGGRWNSPGVAVVYTAESQSLAALELLVHLDSAELLGKYVVFEVGIHEALIARLDPTQLPKNWRADPALPRVRQIGDTWAAAGTSAVLQVPSATVPAEFNFLLNPHHEEFAKLRIGPPSPFRLDARLARKP